MGQHSAPDEEPQTPFRCGIQALAAGALAIIAIATVLAVAYTAIVKGDDASTTLLGTLATGAMGALIVMAGAKRG